MTRLDRTPRRHVPPHESGNFHMEQCASSITVQSQVSAEGGGGIDDENMTKWIDEGVG